MMRHTTSPKRNLPMNLAIIRNGVSEGALAIKNRYAGKSQKLDPSFVQMHNSRWRLTNFGKIQAEETGKWLQKNFPPISAYICGEYTRSLETAACLKLPNAQWMTSLYLRPRDFGLLSEFDFMPDQEELDRIFKKRNRDEVYWTPPGGESFAHLTMRTERVVHLLRSHVHPDAAAVIVTHKDVMEALRMILEGLGTSDYRDKILNPNRFQLKHCSILQYSRQNPKTGEEHNEYKFVRVVTPWTGSDNEFVPWKEIPKREFTNEMLEKAIEKFNIGRMKILEKHEQEKKALPATK